MFLQTLVLLGFITLSTSDCPPDTISEFNKCYKLFTTPAPFLTAEGECEKIGGTLVSIQNSNENYFIVGIVASSRLPKFWIGASLLLSAQWSWTSQAPFSYYNWARGQPSGEQNQCGSVWQANSTWMSEMCSDPLPFVCQIDPNATLPSRECTCPAATVQDCQTSTPPSAVMTGTSTVASTAQQGSTLSSTTRSPVPLNCLFVLDWSYFGQGLCAQTYSATCDDQKTYVANVAQILYSNPRLAFQAGFGFYGDVDQNHCFDGPVEDGYYSSSGDFSNAISYREPSNKCPTTVCDALEDVNSANLSNQQCLVFISAEANNSFNCIPAFNPSNYQYVFGVELNGGTGVDTIATNAETRVTITDAFTQADADSLANTIASFVSSRP